LSTALSGFGSGDEIVLDGVTANKESYSGGTLTLKNGNTPVETLHFKGSYTSFDFHVETHAAGTFVTFNSSAESAASIQDQIFDSALLSGSSAHHRLDAIGERAGATPDLWSVGHGPGPSG
jgi:hypothetical protein